MENPKVSNPSVLSIFLLSFFSFFIISEIIIYALCRIDTSRRMKVARDAGPPSVAISPSI